jgi:hypothetical protein
MFYDDRRRSTQPRRRPPVYVEVAAGKARRLRARLTAREPGVASTRSSNPKPTAIRPGPEPAAAVFGKWWRLSPVAPVPSSPPLPMYTRVGALLQVPLVG